MVCDQKMWFASTQKTRHPCNEQETWYLPQKFKVSKSVSLFQKKSELFHILLKQCHLKSSSISLLITPNAQWSKRILEILNPKACFPKRYKNEVSFHENCDYCLCFLPAGFTVMSIPGMLLECCFSYT